MNNKGFSLISSLIIVLIGLAIIGLYISVDRNNNVSNDTELEKIVSETLNKDNSNWNFYESTKMGVTFEYPPSCRIEEELNKIKVIETPLGKSSDPSFPIEPYSFYAYLSVEDNINNYTPEEYFTYKLCYEGVPPDETKAEWPNKLKQSCVDLFNESMETYNANGIEGILGTYNLYERGHPIFVFTKNGKIYAFHLGNTGETGHSPDTEQIALFKEILTTLELTKKMQT